MRIPPLFAGYNGISTTYPAHSRRLAWTVVLALSAWLMAWPALALEWRDGRDFRYSLSGDGALQEGEANAFAGLAQLRVNGALYHGNRARVDAATQQLDTTPVRLGGNAAVGGNATVGGNTAVADLQVSRQVWVSPKDNWARFSEIIHNPGTQAMPVVIEVFGNLGTGNPSTLRLQQDGFFIADDGDGGAPAILHYHNQPDPVLGMVPKVTQDSRALHVQYPAFTLPPGASVRLLHFIAQAPDLGQATQLADYLRANGEPLFEHLDAVARKSLKNFVALTPLPDRNFSNAPKLAVGESRIAVLDTQQPYSHLRAATRAVPYALEVAAAQTVTLRMAAEFDSYLAMYADANGTQLLAKNDDRAPGNRNAELTYTPAAAGTVYVEAMAYRASEAGAFSLETLAGSYNRAPVAMPMEVSPVETDTQAEIRFTDYSQDPDGRIVERCWDFGDRTGRTCGADATVSHAYATPGRYTVTLTVRDASGAMATQTAQARVRAPRAGVTLQLRSDINNELLATDSRSSIRANALADRYVIPAAPAGKELAVDLKSTEFDAYLYLFDEYGQLLRQDDNSAGGNSARIRYTPPHEMDLLLEATSVAANATGAYQLQAALADGRDALTVPLNALASTTDALQYTLLLRLPENFTPTRVEWNTGEGPIAGTLPLYSTEATLIHRYAAPGTYTVQARAQNAQGRLATGTVAIVASTSRETLAVSVQASPLYGDPPLKTFFTVNATLAGAPSRSLAYEWDFGDGTVSAEANPSHLYTRAGNYPVRVRVTSPATGASMSAQTLITVIDRDAGLTPVTGVARQRPQVILAGFDPALVDLTATDIRLFALVRPGANPVQSVLVRQNGGAVILALQHTATLATGELYYEGTLNFHNGVFPVVSFMDLFGDLPGQFTMQAIDNAEEFHNFPYLEFSAGTTTATPSMARGLVGNRNPGAMRVGPQVLGGGFQLPQADVRASEVEFLALVREGATLLREVTVQGPGIRLPMRQAGLLPNGDRLYRAVYTFPSGVLQPMVLGRVWGGGAEQFTLHATDQAGNNHRFPELRIGNYAQR